MNDFAQQQLSPEQRAALEGRFKLERRARNGAQWFYWIGGLSVLNSIIALADGSFFFIFGLGITQVIDAFASVIGAELGMEGFSPLAIFALALDLLAVAVFLVLGYFSVKRNRIAYIVGMVLFGADAILVTVFGDWLGLLFHAFVFIGLIRGFSATRELLAADRAAGSAAPYQVPVPAPGNEVRIEPDV